MVPRSGVEAEVGEWSEAVVFRAARGEMEAETEGWRLIRCARGLVYGLVRWPGEFFNISGTVIFGRLFSDSCEAGGGGDGDSARNLFGSGL